MSMIYARWGTRGRAGRLVALAGLAERLVPDDPNTAWILSNIFEIRREPRAAADAMRIRLQADPSDHALGVSYLRMGAAARDRPDDRTQFLQSVLDDMAYPDSLRAQAAVELGRMLMEAAQKAEALQMFGRAVQLDRLNGEAIDGLLAAAGGPPSVEDRTAALVNMIMGNPRSQDLTRTLAAVLGSIGLHEQAAELLENLWKSAAAGGATPPADLTGQYLTVLLDAGMYEKAIEIFRPRLDEFPDNRDLRMMLIEAYRATGRNAEADHLAQYVVDRFSKAAPADLSLSEAAEQTWFYTVLYPRPDLVMERAKRATESAINNPVARRLLGAAELASGQPDLVAAGKDRLEALAATDEIAAALLAEHYASTGDAEAAGKVIQSVVDKARGGWPFRRARDTAAKLGIPITPHPKAQAVEQVAGQLDKRYFEMGRFPEKYLSVSMKAVDPSRLAGQPIQVEAVLTNVGDLPVMLGSGGLMNPVMSLEVAAEKPRKERFTSLPSVVWPAPRYLQPGGSVRTTVRLDVGSLQYYLARCPLEEVTLTVTGTIDPVQQAGQTVSSMPSLKVDPVVITRRDLMGSFDRSSPQQWRQAYEHMLRVVVTDLIRGSIQQRMQAARQVGELLTLTRDAQLFKVRLPDELRGVVNKAVLLAMTKKAMEDPSPAVRAEMLAALCDASLDDSILAVVSPAAKDPTPLVRCRMAELLGAAAVKGQEATMDMLSGDSDPFVRQMVVAFQSHSVSGG